MDFILPVNQSQKEVELMRQEMALDRRMKDQTSFQEYGQSIPKHDKSARTQALSRHSPNLSPKNDGPKLKQTQEIHCDVLAPLE